MAPVVRSWVIFAVVAILGGMAPGAMASPAEAHSATTDQTPKAANGAQEPVRAAPARPRQWSVTLQTGLAETFQLTLGGVFGAGPAWQSRVILTRTNVFRDGDSVSLTGFNSHNTPNHNNDWTAAIGYRTRLLSKRGHVFHAGGGFERWRFPGVLRGAQDWIAAYHAAYSSKFKGVPVTVQTHGWSVLHSPLTHGSLAYTTVWFDQKLYANDRVKVVLRHGPQHTYSWNFYGTNGHRVVRYAGALVVTSGPNTFEAGYRPQYGLKPRIPHNRFWHFMLSRTF